MCSTPRAGWGVITDNVQEHELADGWRGRNLTFIDALVLALRVPDPQRPLLGVRRVHRLKALVRRVRVPTHGQQMDVTMSHPGHLLIEHDAERMIKVVVYLHHPAIAVRDGG